MKNVIDINTGKEAETPRETFKRICGYMETDHIDLAGLTDKETLRIVYGWLHELSICAECVANDAPLDEVQEYIRI